MSLCLYYVVGFPTLSLDGARIYIVRTINCIAARRQLIRGIQDSPYRGSVGDSTNSIACLFYIYIYNKNKWRMLNQNLLLQALSAFLLLLLFFAAVSFIVQTTF